MKKKQRNAKPQVKSTNPTIEEISKDVLKGYEELVINDKIINNVIDDLEIDSPKKIPLEISKEFMDDVDKINKDLGSKPSSTTPTVSPASAPDAKRGALGNLIENLEKEPSSSGEEVPYSELLNASKLHLMHAVSKMAGLPISDFINWTSDDINISSWQYRKDVDLSKSPSFKEWNKRIPLDSIIYKSRILIQVLIRISKDLHSLVANRNLKNNLGYDKNLLNIMNEITTIVQEYSSNGSKFGYKPKAFNFECFLEIGKFNPDDREGTEFAIKSTEYLMGLQDPSNEVRIKSFENIGNLAVSTICQDSDVWNIRLKSMSQSDMVSFISDIGKSILVEKENGCTIHPLYRAWGKSNPELHYRLPVKGDVELSTGCRAMSFINWLLNNKVLNLYMSENLYSKRGLF